MGVDNTAAIQICESSGVTARNKHFSDATHYVRRMFEDGRIRLVFVPTDKQKADGFTKILDSAKFFSWRQNVVVTHLGI